MSEIYTKEQLGLEVNKAVGIWCALLDEFLKATGKKNWLEFTMSDKSRLIYVAPDKKTECEVENEKLKAENARLKVCELKTYHDGYKDGLTACNTVGAEEALEDIDFHYCKWVEKKDQGE